VGVGALAALVLIRARHLLAVQAPAAAPMAARGPDGALEATG